MLMKSNEECFNKAMINKGKLKNFKKVLKMKIQNFTQNKI